MLDSLFSKTFGILSLQFLITWTVTVLTIRWFRERYYRKQLGITATHNEAGDLDLHLDFAAIKPFFNLLLIADIIVFVLLLFFGTGRLSMGLPLFCIWSVTTGILLALTLLSVDENLGAKVLAITACITFGAAVIGMYSKINFMFLGPILFWALILLIVGNMVRLFISIPGSSRRVMAFFGCLIFTGYLLFDFHRLARAGKDEACNTWPVAMDFAIDIYLDVINLFLELLDLLSD